MYELITRHFLACVAPDAIGEGKFANMGKFAYSVGENMGKSAYSVGKNMGKLAYSVGQNMGKMHIVWENMHVV